MSPAPNEVVLGPSGRRVVQNVARLRAERGLTREALSERLGLVGRPIRATSLARLEAGKRRVDADDLVALALALDVSPLQLLLPAEPTERVELTDERAMPWDETWRWAGARPPGDLDERVAALERVVDALRGVPLGGGGPVGVQLNPGELPRVLRPGSERE